MNERKENDYEGLDPKENEKWKQNIQGDDAKG